eukprot:scaffold53237_cov28-Tisochrysis_lutea.AAC.1
MTGAPCESQAAAIDLRTPASATPSHLPSVPLGQRQQNTPQKRRASAWTQAWIPPRPSARTSFAGPCSRPHLLACGAAPAAAQFCRSRTAVRRAATQLAPSQSRLRH